MTRSRAISDFLSNNVDAKCKELRENQLLMHIEGGNELKRIGTGGMDWNRD